MEIYNRVIETSFKVEGLKGKISIENTGAWISASVDCKQFIPDGKPAKHHNSYIDIQKPTAKQIAEIFRRIADYEEKNLV